MCNYHEDSQHFGKIKGDSINTNITLKPWDIGTPSYYCQPDWSDTDFACPDCGGQMQRQNNVVYTSNPPMYGYRCKKCGAFHYRFS